MSSPLGVLKPSGLPEPAEDRRRVRDFVAYYEIDAGNGVMATISVFEDQAGEEASTERAAEWVRENEASMRPTRRR
jgi:hypothetical protein